MKSLEELPAPTGPYRLLPSTSTLMVEGFQETVDVRTFSFSEPLQGEDVGVAVVLRSSSDEVLIGMHRWASEHLAVRQMLKRRYVVQEIPRTSRGKINRRDVAEFCDRLSPVPFAKLLGEGAAE